MDLSTPIRADRQFPVSEALGLAALVTAFVAFGTMFALYMGFSDGEWSFPIFGRMALLGEIRLFQEEIVGRRLPLPFYVIGVSQLAGPNLLAARLWSLSFGAAAVLLTFALARSIGGRLCAFLAALFVVTHAVVVGFYASASYYAMSATLMLLGLLVLAAWRSPRGRLLGMACFSVMWLSRAHLLPMIPFVLGYLLLEARDRRERLTLILVTAVPPVAFLAWHPDHIKVLAYVPGFDRLVAPLGYRSLLGMGAEDLIPDWQATRWIVWFVKRHFFWLVTTSGLAVAWGIASARRPTGLQRLRARSFVVFLAVLTVYTLASQVAVIHVYPKAVAAWATAFAPLWAVVMGYAAAVLLEREATPALVRRGVAFMLLAVFALGPTLARHAAMPRPLPPETTLALIASDAVAIRSVIPKGARVFLLGNPIPTYVAEVSPYLQQVFGFWTLVPSIDDYAVRRSGLWGARQVREWLGADAPYAVVDANWLAHLRKIASYRELVDQIQTLLGRHFTLVATVGHSPWTPVLHVYARNESSRTAPAAGPLGGKVASR